MFPANGGHKHKEKTQPPIAGLKVWNL